jgi:hypothetical protein
VQRDNPTIDRRSVLQSISAAGVAAVGSSGVVSALPAADEDRVLFPEASERAVGRWEDFRGDRAAKRRAFQEHFAPVAEKMEKEGIEVPEFNDTTRTTTSPDKVDGVDTAHVGLIFDREEETVSVHIYPHVGRSVAVLHRESESRLFTSDDDVTTEGCYISAECTDIECDYGQTIEAIYEYCQYPDGSTEKYYRDYRCGC